LRSTNPDKATRRRRGKTDTIDAESAARAVLSGRASSSAKAGDGPVEMLRMFKLAKASALKARTQTINQLKAVLVAADPALREALSGLSNTLATIGRLDGGVRRAPLGGCVLSTSSPSAGESPSIR
jgi:transposase